MGCGSLQRRRWLTTRASALILPASACIGPDAVPRVLVADDNPLSLRFLADALGGFGLEVVVAHDGIAALEAASSGRFDLLLLDARMPGLGGAAVLARLRAGHGPNADVIALATTAAPDAAIARTLLAAGFAEVVPKPVALQAFEAVLARHLPGPGPAWTVGDRAGAGLDDARALRASGGDAGVTTALRALLVAELESLRDECQALAGSGDLAGLRECLHRLDASAGFCGATALAAAIGGLRGALGQANAWPQEAIDDFLHGCDTIRTALVEAAARREPG
jgi:CheY-like chemotaxis protein